MAGMIELLREKFSQFADGPTKTAIGESPTISAAVEDPVIAMIAEEARLEALARDADRRGDEIFDALPEDIRKGRVQVSLNGELGRLLQHSGFASEANLDNYPVEKHHCHGK
jgi:hypothetical protein